MRYYTVSVNINGDRNHVVHLPKVSAAEIMVLRTVHGTDSVMNIKLNPVNGETREKHSVVIEYLAKKYRKTRVGSGSNATPVLVKVFPGWPNIKPPESVEGLDLPEVFFAQADSEERKLELAAAAEQQAKIDAANKAAEEKLAAEGGAADAGQKAVARNTYWRREVEDGFEYSMTKLGEVMPGDAEPMVRADWEEAKQHAADPDFME